VQGALVWLPGPTPEPGSTRAKAPPPRAARPQLNTRIKCFRWAWLAWYHDKCVGGESVAGGSLRHFTRVTSPFPATHRSINPATTPLSRSPFTQLRRSRCSLLLSSSLFLSCSLIVRRFMVYCFSPSFVDS
jgi:hypothetical protein